MKEVNKRFLAALLFCGFAICGVVGLAIVASGLLIGYLVNYFFASVSLGSAVVSGTIASGMGLWALGTCLQMFVTMSQMSGLMTNHGAAMGVHDESDEADEEDDDPPHFTDEQMKVLAAYLGEQLMDRIEERSARRPIAQRKRR